MRRQRELRPPDPERQHALAAEAYQAATTDLQEAARRYGACILQTPARNGEHCWPELAAAADAFSRFKRVYEQFQAATDAKPAKKQ